MKKLIIWLKLFEKRDLSVLFTWLGLIVASPQINRKEQVVNHLEDRETMKLVQIESYLRANDHQGIVNLALYC